MSDARSLKPQLPAPKLLIDGQLALQLSQWFSFSGSKVKREL